MAIGPRGEKDLPGQTAFRSVGFGKIAGMVEELWRPSLDLALHRNRHSPQSRYVQLATLRENGPASRAEPSFFGASLATRTDSPSPPTLGASRSASSSNAPWAEACWYFHQTREQFRFPGP